MKIYIYIIWFPTSKKYYVGQTYDLKRRLLYQHLKEDSLVGRALNKYDDWKILVLHTVKTRDEANRLEIDHIRNFNSVAPNGYNLTRGGDGISGWHHSEETKKKISITSKGRHFTWSEESKVRITGKKRPEHSKIMKNNKYSQGKNIGADNPMRDSKNVLKFRISRLRTAIIKLEKEDDN